MMTYTINNQVPKPAPFIKYQKAKSRNKKIVREIKKYVNPNYTHNK